MHVQLQDEINIISLSLGMADKGEEKEVKASQRSIQQVGFNFLARG